MSADVSFPLKNESSPSLLPTSLANRATKNGMMGSSNNFCTFSQATSKNLAAIRGRKKVLKHSLNLPQLHIQHRFLAQRRLAAVAVPVVTCFVKGGNSFLNPNLR